MFVKGASGNPGGRPRKTSEQYRVDEACRKLSLKAVDVLVDIMENGADERNRLKAAETILHRGQGRPRERPGQASLSERPKPGFDAALIAELKRRGYLRISEE
jgi:hypothetical protein